MWKDGKEDAPLEEKSPFWMDVRILTGDGKPAKELPLKDGYEGTTAQGWLLRDGAAQGVLRGQPEGDHAELDRLLMSFDDQDR
jgi:hypothetical protein